MAWVAVDKNKKECVYDDKPIRSDECFYLKYSNGEGFVDIPNGSIKKLIGYELTWNDEPVELI